MPTLDQRLKFHGTGKLLRQCVQLRAGVGPASLIGVLNIRLPLRCHGDRLDDMNEQQRARDLVRQICGPAKGAYRRVAEIGRGQDRSPGAGGSVG